MGENTDQHMTSQTSTEPPLWRRALGKPSDWQLRRPHIALPKPGLHWTGPLAIAASVAVSWFAFAGATGEEGNVAFGLFIGAASILLMAWSFVLAVRIRLLERFFGGLDSMYRVHRWAGVLSIGAMYLHTSVEPEIEGGIRGASESLADQAEGLAGTGQTMLYILVAASVLRWLPYRWWRWTHKLLGIPFAFACFHFFTAEKTYANGDPWGWYFGAFMLAGLAAFVVRVIGRDAIARGSSYRVSAASVHRSTLELELEPAATPLRYEAGQFAVLKVQRKGLTEPHIFTIASSPDEGVLRFYIRDLGDWTARMHAEDLEGAEVIVEGPYGEFDPIGHSDGPTVWVAGGVGITPFLSAATSLPVTDAADRPTLFYCVRDVDDAMAIDRLREAERNGQLHLVICSSADGTRFGETTLVDRFGPDGLRNAHIAVCGPAGLVSSVRATGSAMGADEVEHEDFDIRQGFGPDLSRDVAALTSRIGVD